MAIQVRKPGKNELAKAALQNQAIVTLRRTKKAFGKSVTKGAVWTFLTKEQKKIKAATHLFLNAFMQQLVTTNQ